MIIFYIFYEAFSDVFILCVLAINVKGNENLQTLLISIRCRKVVYIVFCLIFYLNKGTYRFVIAFLLQVIISLSLLFYCSLLTACSVRHRSIKLPIL